MYSQSALSIQIRIETGFDISLSKGKLRVSVLALLGRRYIWIILTDGR